APQQNYPDTWAYYRPGDQAAGADVARILGGGATAAPLPAAIGAVTGPKAQVAVVMGRGFVGKLAVTAPKKTHAKPSGPPATITPTTEYRADFQRPESVLHSPIMSPTVPQADSSLCPWVPQPAGP